MDKKGHRIGQVLQETYRLERLLGKGGMGEVYECSHARLARRFALKVLSAPVVNSEEVLTRFQREAQITSALGNPHILEVIDFNVAPDGYPYMVMELLEGEPLSARIGRLGRLSLEATVGILSQTASALQAAHDQGVVHRDLKPENIFLCRRPPRDDFVKVLDFGVSKIAGSLVTRTEQLLGTPCYMAPEQITEGAAGVDLRADIYALGVLVFEMLTGRLPFQAASILSLLYLVAHQEPPALASFRPELPAAVGAVVARALRKHREERFASAEELQKALEAAASATAVRAEPIARAAEADDDEATLVPTTMELASSPLHELPTKALEASSSAPVTGSSRSINWTPQPEPEPETETPLPLRRRWPLALGAMAVVFGSSVAGSFYLSRRPAARTSAAAGSVLARPAAPTRAAGGSAPARPPVPAASNKPLALIAEPPRQPDAGAPASVRPDLERRLEPVEPTRKAAKSSRKQRQRKQGKKKDWIIEPDL